jgi:hypothetical protein
MQSNTLEVCVFFLQNYDDLSIAIELVQFGQIKNEPQIIYFYVTLTSHFNCSPVFCV